MNRSPMYYFCDRFPPVFTVERKRNGADSRGNYQHRNVEILFACDNGMLEKRGYPTTVERYH